MIEEIIEEELEEVQLNVGIDGLSLFKSSLVGLWPILGRVSNLKRKPVFLIGSYVGDKKPYIVDVYLHDFVEEVKYLSTNGFLCKNNSINVLIRAIICDTPARSYVCGIKGHTALNGCSKCTQKGQRIRNVIVFSSFTGDLRTDTGFANRFDKDFHLPYYKDRIHCLEEINLKMITQFPLDAMHLIDLGVVKKMINIILNGKSATKIGSKENIELSSLLTSLAPYIPRDFARKPRCFRELPRWKAIEFRQFILYTGLIVFKDALNDDMYYHFLLLNCAYRLLLYPKNFSVNIETANGMLKYFVERFADYYGETSVTSNVHNLLHLTDCVRTFGCLDTFSSYSFENYLQIVKNSIKKPQHIP